VEEILQHFRIFCTVFFDLQRKAALLLYLYSTKFCNAADSVNVYHRKLHFSPQKILGPL